GVTPRCAVSCVATTEFKREEVVMRKPRTVRKTSEELAEDFRIAFRHLDAALARCAAGDLSEATHLAALVYMFVHDYGKSSVSLFTHVGRKGAPFHDTAHALNPSNLLTESPLTGMQIGTSGAGALPLFAMSDGGPLPPKEVAFSRWWEVGVLRDNKRRIFSRKNLIFALRNRGGGGHVADIVPEE